jgi:hypothetical protein
MDYTPTCPLFQLTNSVMLMSDHTPKDLGPFAESFRITNKLEKAEKVKSSNNGMLHSRRNYLNLKSLQAGELRKYYNTEHNCCYVYEMKAYLEKQKGNNKQI